MRAAALPPFSASLVRLCLCAIACLASASELLADGPGRPLTPRTPAAQESSPASASSQGAAGSLLTTCGALGLVVMLFVGLVKLWRKNLPAAPRPLSADVFEILGYRQLTAKQGVQLIRIGGRLLVVGISEQGLNTLAEITDTDEVEHLAQTCRVTDRGETESGFRALYEKFRQQRADGANSIPITKPTRLSELQETAHE